MQIRSDLSVSSLMKIAFSNMEGMQLQKGELVSAIVDKSLGDGLFLVNIRGTQIEAATNLMLIPGQSLLLKSDGIENGRLILRIVKPGEEQAVRVANHLQGMGYRVDDSLTAAATKLMQYGLPLTRENVDLILNSTRLLGEISPQNLETAAWALAGGLKTKQDLLAAIKNFMAQPQMIKQVLEQAAQNLAILNETPGESSVTNPPSSKLSLQSGAELETLLSVLTGLDAAKFSSSPNRLNGETPGNQFPIGDQRLNSIEGLIKTIVSLIAVRGTEDAEAVKQDLQRFIGTNKEVIRALALIQEVLVNSSETGKPLLNETVKLLQAAEGELLGQAAFNSAERQTNNQQPGFYYFAIPLEINGADRTMELRVYKDDRGKRRLDELEEVRLAVSLSTANLGIVLFHVTWQKDAGLVIQGAVNNTRSKEIIEQDFDSLKQRLIDIGYRVQFLGMKVAAEPERLRPGFETKELEIRMLGIDIRV